VKTLSSSVILDGAVTITASGVDQLQNPNIASIQILRPVFVHLEDGGHSIQMSEPRSAPFAWQIVDWHVNMRLDYMDCRPAILGP
jgi:hypothetical protein